jgi:hypothetical protein
MKTTYLVWKDPSCNGINPVWQKISGKEFLAIVRAKTGRHFIKLSSTELNGADGAIVMETTAAVYTDWKREKNRRDYLSRVNGGCTTLSYHALETVDGRYGEEMLSDNTVDIEGDCLQMMDRQTLKAALDELTEDEYYLIALLYLSVNKHTEQEVADIFGISQQLLNYRKKAILKKLRKKFGD